ncbi:class I SAM-dependent methyltransferase [Kosakonia sp. BYX6]|uniref:Class I SAM-dependent methyltransferase n=1 Tax=Kosakonia calanthes TaxID=3139408 RepID=A0ABZ3B6Z9_9ENTR
MDLKETEILGDDVNTHWYYLSKAKALTKLLGNFTPKKIMDIGAGSGYFSKLLLNETTASEAWCVDISYEREETANEHGKPIHFVRGIDETDADLVLLMDVLEHVDDDVGLLKEYVDKVPANTKFLISVPAFEWLWSPHDDFLEHRRRYTLRQLESVVQSTGLSIERSCYYFGVVLPLAVLTRFASRNSGKKESQLKRHSKFVNTVLKTLCSLDLIFFEKNKVGGLTVFCYAEKKEK